MLFPINLQLYASAPLCPPFSTSNEYSISVHPVFSSPLYLLPQHTPGRLQANSQPTLPHIPPPPPVMSLGELLASPHPRMG